MYKKNSHIHFIGIGGIGMSGIATILKQSGYMVSGCDPDITQPTISQLQSLGCPVYHGNNTAACADISIDIVVYIPMYEHTIPAISAEIMQARSRNIITVSRAQMLAEIMRSYYGIAIAGSHGKTTTSALIAHTLLHARHDPTVVIGGNLKNISSNAHKGSGDFFVAEADESDRSFLYLNPTLTVITNIDLEHLETYQDLDDIKQTFIQFINKLPFYGKAVVCTDDTNLASIISYIKAPTISYGIHNLADIQATNIVLEKEHSYFEVYKKNSQQSLGHVKLPIAGIHNVYNALATIAITQEIGVPFESVALALSCFSGVDRRFSFHGTYKGAEIFDDYGHHPKEIELTLAVAKKRTQNKLTVVFQPHRYTRTEKLWDDFITIFANGLIDTLIITDIYSAGESPIQNITSERLVQELQSFNKQLNVLHIPFTESFDLIKSAINAHIQPNDLILFLGAGKLNLIAEELI